MTEPMAPHRTTSTLPPPSANRSTRSPPAPWLTAIGAAAALLAACQLISGRTGDAMAHR